MVGNSKRCGTLPGFLYRLCLLCTILVASSCNQYRKGYCQQSLNPSKAHIRPIDPEMKKGLFKFYGGGLKIVHQSKAKAEVLDAGTKELMKLFEDQQKILYGSKLQKAKSMNPGIKDLSKLYGHQEKILKQSSAKEANPMVPELNDLFKLYGDVQKIQTQSTIKKAEFMDSGAKKLLRLCGDRQRILNQSKAMAKLMEPEIVKLYNLYVCEQELEPFQYVCDKPVDWFPKEDIPSLPETTMLQTIYSTLVTMLLALSSIIGQQIARHPESSLIANFKSVESTTLALESNIYSALYLQHAVPMINVTSADIPTPYKVFEQKIGGCRVLKTYIKFIRDVALGLKRITKRRCGTSQKERSEQL